MAVLDSVIVPFLYFLSSLLPSVVASPFARPPRFSLARSPVALSPPSPCLSVRRPILASTTPGRRRDLPFCASLLSSPPCARPDGCSAPPASLLARLVTGFPLPSPDRRSIATGQDRTGQDRTRLVFPPATPSLTTFLPHPPAKIAAAFAAGLLSPLSLSLCKIPEEFHYQGAPGARSAPRFPWPRRRLEGGQGIRTWFWATGLVVLWRFD